MGGLKLLSSIQFADAIGVSHSTVKKWHNNGILTAHIVTPTGRRQYTQQQVTDYFNRCRVQEVD